MNQKSGTMNLMRIIKTRKSVRTFDGRKLADDDKEKILSYINTIGNPYDIPVEFVELDCKNSLSSPVIEGEDFYIAGKLIFEEPEIEKNEYIATVPCEE